MLKAVAIDDEPLPLELLEKFCAQSEFVTLERTFWNIGEAQQYLSDHTVDLLFLDIQMPKLSGIDLYKSLEQDIMVIFTTAHSQYAVDGFNLNAVDYLLKPFSYERFQVAVKKASEYREFQNKRQHPGNQYLYVKSNYKLHKISFSEILYIESFADYLDIHLDKKEKITVRMTLKNMLEQLPSTDFLRVHRSFIVALDKIIKVNQQTIFLPDIEIPVGVNYKEDFTRKFKT